MRRVMPTRYRIDDYQQTYFVIDSFDDLLKQTLQTDFAPLHEELKGLPDLDGNALLPEDKVYARGRLDVGRLAGAIDNGAVFPPDTDITILLFAHTL
jgi:hypothetical protein